MSVTLAGSVYTIAVWCFALAYTIWFRNRTVEAAERRFFRRQRREWSKAARNAAARGDEARFYHAKDQADQASRRLEMEKKHAYD